MANREPTQRFPSALASSSTAINFRLGGNLFGQTNQGDKDVLSLEITCPYKLELIYTVRLDRPQTDSAKSSLGNMKALDMLRRESKEFRLAYPIPEISTLFTELIT